MISSICSVVTFDSCQRGAMRRAPSSRMTSPFNIGFSMICFTSAAYSAGRAQSGRKRHALTERLLHVSRQARHHGRFKDAWRNSYHPHSEAREVTRRGQRQPNHASFGRCVRRLTDLSVEGGDRCGVNDDAALAFGVGRFIFNGVNSKPHHVEGADEIDSDGTGKAFEPMRSIATNDLFARSDAGAIHEALGMSGHFLRELDSGVAVFFFAGDIGHLAFKVRPQARRSIVKGVRIYVDPHYHCALGYQHSGHGQTKARGGSRDQKDSFCDLHNFILKSGAFSSGRALKLGEFTVSQKKALRLATWRLWQFVHEFDLPWISVSGKPALYELPTRSLPLRLRPRCQSASFPAADASHRLATSR